MSGTNDEAAVKKGYYSDAEVVKQYEKRRFGRGGGAYVAQRETAALRHLIESLKLPPGSVALDCPTGTGRFLPLLQEFGFKTIGVDISDEMLGLARQYHGVEFHKASASAVPLPNGSVSVWLMSRFAFHFEDPSPFFQEAARVLMPGRFLVFDIYRWTPRSWIPGKQAFLGGRTHTHSQAKITDLLAKNGLRVVRHSPIFFLAPYIYGLLPSFVPPVLDRISDAIAPRFKTKSYIVAERI